MAILVADVNAVHDAGDPQRALSTLSILTGVVMVAAGLLRLGSVLRFVSNAVMVGFINAVGVNIILGQLGNLTGYTPLEVRVDPRARHGPASGSARRTVGRDRARDDRADRCIGTDARSERSASSSALSSPQPPRTRSVGTSRRFVTWARPWATLPNAVLPELSLVPSLIVPAVSLALVGLVQGAGISGELPQRRRQLSRPVP